MAHHDYVVEAISRSRPAVWASLIAPTSLIDAAIRAFVTGGVSQTSKVPLITLYGVLALGFMMVMYALERRGRIFILAFAVGCLLSSVYGFLSGAWPFGMVEAIWFLVAAQRFRTSTGLVG
jgi:hypothetical protein